ncbi:hypothetical protein CPB83DRAFT_920310, partial [Crepidotus variabilis]
VVQTGAWPDRDEVPPTGSSEVAEWMKELDGHDIPSLSVTKDGSCPSDTAAAADAANRDWLVDVRWTLPSYRSVIALVVADTVACPDKNTWGIRFESFDSGLSCSINSNRKILMLRTLLLGRACNEHWDMPVDEYMNDHEISVHTWSHQLTNQQIVAELGWTRKIIKQVLGVTPMTKRLPYGDIGSFRAISLAMGMVPVFWTQTPSGTKFDTNG